MIGVACTPAQREIVSEFFELFKTPWAFHEPSSAFEVVVSTTGHLPQSPARLVILSSAQPVKDSVNPDSPGDHWTPLPGPCAEARVYASGPSEGRQPSFRERFAGGVRVVELDFDLFEETRYLLTKGQPPDRARVPSLDLHIRFLRDLIIESGIPVVEIPPMPEGAEFVVCLTHDVDHPLLRQHRVDHTMFGYLGRASAGSLIDFLRGRLSVRNLAKNWGAAVSLPAVQLGLSADPWAEFAESYSQVETGLGSTFFVLPRKGYPGRAPQGSAPQRRASGYEASEIVPQLNWITRTGGEIALHGIDAWQDATAGREERLRVEQSSGRSADGVRMHWLYFDEDSPRKLDDAGFDYDSTVGYNQTIGFRAGTAQAYRHPGTHRLLELPLHVMDTALFYPSYLHLTITEATRAVEELIRHIEELGGVLTINWHDRSLAPERLWKDFYTCLLTRLKAAGAWFPTAGAAVNWFRLRREAAFQEVVCRREGVKIRASAPVRSDLPGLRVRVHPPAAAGTRASAGRGNPRPVDLSLRSGATDSFVEF